MAISVVTNVASIRSQRNLAKVTLSTSQNIERLSSGLRINRAGDDAARSAISSQMSALQLGLKLEVVSAARHRDEQAGPRPRSWAAAEAGWLLPRAMDEEGGEERGRRLA